MLGGIIIVLAIAVFILYQTVKDKEKQSQNSFEETQMRMERMVLKRIHNYRNGKEGSERELWHGSVYDERLRENLLSTPTLKRYLKTLEEFYNLYTDNGNWNDKYDELVQKDSSWDDTHVVTINDMIEFVRKYVDAPDRNRD